MSAYPDTAPGASSDPRVFRIDVQGTSAAEYFMLDDEGVVTPDQGWAGWEEQQRLGRRAALSWSGSQAWQQTIPFWIDAWDGGSRVALVRRQLEVIRQLCETDSTGSSPHLATLSGSALWREGTDWAMVGFTRTACILATADDPHRDISRNDVLRVRGTMVFKQRLSADVLAISKPLSVGYRMHVVKPGETLRKIAVTELGAENRYKEIRYADGRAITDPVKAQKPGTKLRIPPRGTL